MYFYVPEQELIHLKRFSSRKNGAAHAVELLCSGRAERVRNGECRSLPDWFLKIAHYGGDCDDEIAVSNPILA